MEWKERLKPDNNAEAGCYKIILFVGLFALALAISSTLNIDIDAFFGMLMLGVFLLGETMSTTHQILENYEVSRSRAFFLSLLLSVFVIAGLFIVLFIVFGGISILLRSLFIEPDQINGLIYLAFLFVPIWAWLKQAGRVKLWYFDHVLNLPAKVGHDVIANDSST